MTDPKSFFIEGTLTTGNSSPEDRRMAERAEEIGQLAQLPALRLLRDYVRGRYTDPAVGLTAAFDRDVLRILHDAGIRF